jgi:hypothetical protein
MSRGRDGPGFIASDGVGDNSTMGDDDDEAAVVNPLRNVGMFTPTAVVGDGTTLDACGPPPPVGHIISIVSRGLWVRVKPYTHAQEGVCVSCRCGGGKCSVDSIRSCSLHSSRQKCR